MTVHWKRGSGSRYSGTVAVCYQRRGRKVVAAAEVLVQPARALGTSMQMAKAQLETAELFAWTLATILAAALSQLLLHAFFALSRYRNTTHKL